MDKTCITILEQYNMQFSFWFCMRNQSQMGLELHEVKNGRIFIFWLNYLFKEDNRQPLQSDWQFEAKSMKGNRMHLNTNGVISTTGRRTKAEKLLPNPQFFICWQQFIPAHLSLFGRILHFLAAVIFLTFVSGSAISPSSLQYHREISAGLCRWQRGQHITSTAKLLDMNSAITEKINNGPHCSWSFKRCGLMGDVGAGWAEQKRSKSGTMDLPLLTSWATSIVESVGLR